MSSGLRVGFLSVAGPVLTKPQFFHEKIRRLLDGGKVTWLDPEVDAACSILLAEHPAVFARTPSRPVKLRPEAVICALQHPPLDGRGEPQYYLPLIERTLTRLFDAKVIFAPVGPAVRKQVEALPPDFSVTQQDFVNLVDVRELTPRRSPPPVSSAILGRHSRPDPLKWLDTAEEIRLAYPDDRDFRVRILGGPPPRDVLPVLPRNWQVLPFGAIDVGSFLRSLHFFVYFHSAKWVEAFGLSIAEALAAGLVAIVDEAFKPLFEEGAVYAPPRDVADTVRRFTSDPASYEAQCQRARDLVRRKFSTENYMNRFQSLLDEAGVTWTGGQPEPAASRKTRSRLSRDVLFVSSNGVGLGHLTRQLAIALRMPEGIRSVFLTLSQGAGLVERYGYPVDYIPSHQALGVDFHGWNTSLSQELARAVDYYKPRAVVFDGNVPYRGLLAVSAFMRERYWFWVRRAMWKREHQALILDRAMAFDAVFEPAELAADEDVGATVHDRRRVLSVDPILLVEPAERLPREAAIAALGLDPSRPVAAIQLGSGASFAYTELRKAILEYLVQSGRFNVLELVSPIASKDLMQSAGVSGVVMSSVFPSFKFSRAFDLLVTGAGYNTFHECTLAGVSAVFVPYEAPDADDQLLRARYAETMQLGLCLRAKEIDRIPEVIEYALNPAYCANLQQRAARLIHPNGAHKVARFIEECLYSARGMRELGEMIDRV